MTTRFVLCADDFAMTAAVSRSILDLLAAGRLTATGAMTNRPHWPVLAPELAAFAGTADLGLHLNLTCAEPLGPMLLLAPNGTLPSLKELARAAALSRPARREIAAEIGRQIDAFTAATGRAPDFVDGHQHVHVLPGIRRAVIAAVAGLGRGTYLRDPSDRLAAIRARGVAVGKALTVAGLAAGFRQAAQRRGIALNRGFAGFSPFDPRRDFTADLERFLVAAGPAHLVMCHPGRSGDDELARLDPVVATRPVEHDALMRFVPPGGAAMVRFAALEPNRSG